MDGAQARRQTSAESIAGRYRVEQLIAEGGMGQVLAVHDVSTDRRVALKRLLQSNDARLVGMFEREYHTLVRLSHPRIIEVHEYGVDDGRPYYTMELLDGQDLGQLAPLPYKQACRYLRDVASSLALLHARRLLHRDLSPRNVRVTSEDRCKLLDFGALASFGIMEAVVGTPPYVAPEALQHAALDQRSDLFALGALAYWVLTGKHAFAARTLNQLPQLWRAPPPPPSQALALPPDLARSLPAIPARLDELVMSLLTLDPLGRPASAGEVIDRLETIAELAPELESSSARSYLHNAPLVGREPALARLRKRLQRALQGSGASVMLEASSGMGSTRVLSQLGLEAQLAGVTPVLVDAKVHRGLYGVAQAVVEQLARMLPELALSAAREHAAFLARVSPALAAPSAAPVAPPHLPPGELRSRTQSALAHWLCAVAAERPLLISVDNVQRIDEASAALLAAVARSAREHALLLLVVYKPEEAPSSAALLRGLEADSSRVRLQALDRDEVHVLVRGVFGDVQHTGRLADWVHGLSGGNPDACMQLTQQLVDAGVIRFSAGSWVLPQELAPSELPASLSQALEQRLARLSPAARELADGLCVHRGALPIEHCLRLASVLRLPDPHAALEELAQAGVLTQSELGYELAHESLREHLYAQIAPAPRKLLHRRLGQLLSRERQAAVGARLDAGWHLLRGGAETEGADLLASAAVAITQDGDEISMAVPALRAALEVFRRERRPQRALLQLLSPLVLAGYRVDRKLVVEYGDEAIALYRELTGLTLAARLRRWLGKHLSLYIGLLSGLMRAFFVHGLRAAPLFQEQVAAFVSCVATCTGVAATCLDPVASKRYAAVLEPLRALGSKHPATLAIDLAEMLACLTEDRIAETVAGCDRLLARLDSGPVTGLPAGAVALLRGGAYHARSSMLVFRDGPAALHDADRLDALGLRLYAMAADQSRCTYYTLRGDLARARHYHERVESHAIAAGSGWQVEVFEPGTKLMGSLQTRDVIEAKRVVEELDRLSKEVPSLVSEHRLALASYHELKEEPQLAYEHWCAVPELLVPRSYLGWGAGIGLGASLLTALGRAEEARQMCLRALAVMTPEDERYIAMYQKLYTSLALAEAAVGEPALGAQRMEAMIERHRAAGEPVILGNFHATWARIALQMHDLATARAQLAEMERWFRGTQHPALIAQCERLRRELVRSAESLGLALPDEARAADRSIDELQTLRSLLSQCSGPRQRAERVLELVVARARAVRGYLFLYHRAQDRLRLAAPLHGEHPPAELEAAALRAIHEASEAEEAATAMVSISVPVEHTERSSVSVDGFQYRVFALAAVERDELHVVGAVAVAGGSAGLIVPAVALLEALARSLLEAGDDQRTTVRPPDVVS